MPLPNPIIDDRSYQQLRDELVRRIPVYTPEWTDFNASDPGVTLIELFAFLGENLLFRFNQIPETTKLAYTCDLACDLRIVAASARMTAGYARRGLSPDAGVSYFLPRHVGLARAADILLTGRDVDADEAARIGLATEVVADDAFVDRVRAYAAQLAMGAPVAHALTKRLLVRSLDTELDTALRDELVSIKQCFATRDVAEAIAAFREKRRPHFTGE